MKDWVDMQSELKGENDIDVLRSFYCVHTNFSILLTLDDTKKNQLEKMLEFNEKVEGFDKCYEMLGAKKYIIDDCQISYKDSRANGLVDMFETESGDTTTTNASITFFPFTDSLYSQVQLGKETILKVANTLMELKIPFETTSPPSRYTP